MTKERGHILLNSPIHRSLLTYVIIYFYNIPFIGNSYTGFLKQNDMQIIADLT